MWLEQNSAFTRLGCVLLLAGMRGEMIVSERLVLRPLCAEDAEEMVGVLSDERLHDFMGGNPLTLDELRRRYQRLAIGHSADGTETWLNWVVLLRHSSAAVGFVQATVTGQDDQRHAQIAWVTGTAWQRQGIASEATIALVAWLQRGGVATISANVHPRHAASQKVAAHAGLQLTDEQNDGEQVWRRARD